MHAICSIARGAIQELVCDAACTPVIMTENIVAAKDASVVLMRSTLVEQAASPPP